MAIPAAIAKFAIEAAATHYAGDVLAKGLSSNMSKTPTGRAMQFAVSAITQSSGDDDDEVEYKQVDETKTACQCDCDPCTECERKRKAKAQAQFAKQVRAREKPITTSGDVASGVNANKEIPRPPRSFAQDSRPNVNKTTPRAPRSFAQNRSPNVNKTTPRAPTPFDQKQGSPFNERQSGISQQIANTQYLDALQAQHERTVGRDYTEGVDEEQGNQIENPHMAAHEKQDLDCQCPCDACKACEYKQEERDITMMRPTTQQTHEANLSLIADADGEGDAAADGDGDSSGDGGASGTGSGSGAGGAGGASGGA